MGHVEDDERANVLDRATAAIVDEIERTPAATQAGLLVKMRAVRWCRSDSPVDEEDFGCLAARCHRHVTTDKRVVLSLLADLHAMTGGVS